MKKNNILLNSFLFPRQGELRSKRVWLGSMSESRAFKEFLFWIPDTQYTRYARGVGPQVRHDSSLDISSSFRRQGELRSKRVWPKLEFIKKLKNLFTLFFISFLFSSNIHALDVSGRASLAANNYQTSEGDFGYSPFDNTLTSNQQSLRLMFEHSENNFESVLHIKSYRQNFSGFAPPLAHSSDLFRIKALSNASDSQLNIDGGTRLAYAVDQASILYRINKGNVKVGRQAIDWGTGRFWQAMNVFGAFAATDLDTDYKAGIDSVLLNYFPSAFSSLTVAAVFSSDELITQKENYAAFYRRQVGNSSEISLLLAEVLEEQQAGAALEGDFSGIGWRIELVGSETKTTQEHYLNAIAGIDYQFTTGTLVSLEAFHNGLGIESEADISAQLAKTQVAYQLQQHLSEQLLGLALQQTLSPLWNGSYSLLAAELKNNQGESKHSFLHQVSFLYSLANNADLMFALATANGKGLNALGIPQSEFGHVPTSVSIRFRYYF